MEESCVNEKDLRKFILSEAEVLFPEVVNESVLKRFDMLAANVYLLIKTKKKAEEYDLEQSKSITNSDNKKG